MSLFYTYYQSKKSYFCLIVKAKWRNSSNTTYQIARSLYKAILVLRIDDVKQGFQRSIPAGCVALVFHKGNKIISSFHKGTQPQSYISGQISTYSDIEFSFLDMVIILFQPIGCRMFFHILWKSLLIRI